MPKIYTKRGDKGETGLLYGGRIQKNDPRCDAYGTIDEAVAAIGLARTLMVSEDVAKILKSVQKDLFTVGAELATDTKEYGRLKENFSVVTEEMVVDIENLIDEFRSRISLPNAFVIPGGSSSSSALDLSRSIIRRAERHVVTLKELNLLASDCVLRYLNRLSDLLFILARYEDRDLPIEYLID